MDTQTPQEVIKELTSNFTTEEALMKSINALPEALKMQVVYEMSSTESFDDIKYWSIWFIDFLDQNNLINDYAKGTSNRAPLLGFLLAGAKLLEQSSEDMARHELQAQTKDSQWGVELSTRINDYSASIFTAVDQLTTLNCNYESVLKGRQMDYHFTDADGNGHPYTAEELLKRKLMQSERKEK